MIGQKQTKFSLAAAARVAGKSRTTIQAHVKKSKLSYELDGEGHKRIDAAELMRVYGDDCDFDRADPKEEPRTGTDEGGSSTGGQGGRTELHTVQQLLDAERQERDRERRQLESRVEYLEEALRQSQETHQRTTMLLEDRTAGVGGLEESLRKLERRMGEQDESVRKAREEIKQQAKKKIEQLRRELEREREKPLLSRLFDRDHS